MHRTVIVYLASMILAVGCGPSPSTPSRPASSTLPEGFPRRGVVHWSSFVDWDDSRIEEAARSELAILPIQICFSSGGEEVIGRMKSLNPALRIIAYQGLLMTGQLYADSATVWENHPYELEYYMLARDHWAETTTGDTMAIWPGTIFINPFDDGSPDRGLMEEFADLLARYVDARPAVVDGIMHDYFMYRPYIGFGMEETVTGDIDLDGNGIVIADDPAEREAFLRWQIDYAGLLRERLGDDFIQIGNGRVPQENAELAGILNGIFYEVFPNMRWGVTDLEGLGILLDNQAEGYLSEACGKTWSILTNDAVEYNNYFCMVTSMLAGCLYTEIYGSAAFTGWRIDVDAGRALTGLTVEGRADSAITYSRGFANGVARISFGPNGGRTGTIFEEYSE